MVDPPNLSPIPVLTGLDLAYFFDMTNAVTATPNHPFLITLFSGFNIPHIVVTSLSGGRRMPLYETTL